MTAAGGGSNFCTPRRPRLVANCWKRHFLLHLLIYTSHSWIDVIIDILTAQQIFSTAGMEQMFFRSAFISSTPESSRILLQYTLALEGELVRYDLKLNMCCTVIKVQIVWGA